MLEGAISTFQIIFIAFIANALCEAREDYPAWVLVHNLWETRRGRWLGQGKQARDTFQNGNLLRAHSALLLSKLFRYKTLLIPLLVNVIVFCCLPKKSCGKNNFVCNFMSNTPLRQKVLQGK